MFSVEHDGPLSIITRKENKKSLLCYGEIFAENDKTMLVDTLNLSISWNLTSTLDFREKKAYIY